LLTQGLTYDQAQATINGTVSVQLPRWLEVLLHHSNHHLPSHLSISVPSYNLPAAQVSMDACCWGWFLK
jgi:omega-6 fatty acid desaturase (delta-12 desaturase)